MRRHAVTSLSLLALPAALACGPTATAAMQQARPTTDQATTTIAATRSYAALGDAFAGGEGAPADLDGFDAASGSCHRSGLAWPRLVAATNGLSLVAASGGQASAVGGHLACTDAGIPQLLTTANHGEPAQLTRLATLSPTPQVITVTVGAEQARLQDVLLACRVHVNCLETIGAGRTIARTTLATELATAYAQVRSVVPTARVITVGYPRLFSTAAAAAGECPDLTAQQLAALDLYARDLDAALAVAAKAAKVEYVSTLDTLAGHELCTSTEWVNPLALDEGELDIRSGLPTDQGQAALAARVGVYLTRYPSTPVAAPANKKPIATFSYRRKPGTTNRVLLDATKSRDSDGSVRSRVWSTDGRVLGTGKTITVNLGRARSAVVTLTVTDNRGATAKITRTVTAGSSRPR